MARKKRSNQIKLTGLTEICLGFSFSPFYSSSIIRIMEVGMVNIFNPGNGQKLASQYQDIVAKFLLLS